MEFEYGYSICSDKNNRNPTKDSFHPSIKKNNEMIQTKQRLVFSLHNISFGFFSSLSFHFVLISLFDLASSLLANFNTDRYFSQSVQNIYTLNCVQICHGTQSH